MKNINSLRDEKTGRFKTTTDSTRYKMVQFNNQRMSAHAREMCIALNIPKVPKGFIVHHLDENKRNNNIDNLALMTITAHNRTHSHEPWNKGMNKGSNEKWDNTLFKIRQEREKTFFERFEQAHKMVKSGLKQEAVAEKLGVNKATISFRIKRYNELKNKYGK
jgi:DNA-binding XRE family transcriptional regulator